MTEPEQLAAIREHRSTPDWWRCADGGDVSCPEKLPNAPKRWCEPCVTRFLFEQIEKCGQTPAGSEAVTRWQSEVPPDRGSDSAGWTCRVADNGRDRDRSSSMKKGTCVECGFRGVPRSIFCAQCGARVPGFWGRLHVRLFRSGRLRSLMREVRAEQPPAGYADFVAARETIYAGQPVAIADGWVVGFAERSPGPVAGTTGGANFASERHDD